MSLLIIRTPTALQNILQNNGAWFSYYHRYLETIRPAVIDNIIKIMSCGKFVKGYKEYHCSSSDCNNLKYITQSCNSRSCPTCGKRATDQWILKQLEVLPKCDWQHITFTMPKQLWYLFDKHRDLLKYLAKMAAQLIQKLAARKGIKVGIFIALHTFGRDLKWHPHVHVSVSMGGVCQKNNTWKKIKFSKKSMMPMWRYNIISLLRSEMKKGNVDINSSFLTKQYNKNWIMHCSKPTKDPWNTLKYLGRYIKKPPIPLSKLKQYSVDRINFKYLNHKNKKYQTDYMNTDQFIYKFTRHIPEKGMRLITYYGFLANRVRGEMLKLIYTLLDQTVNNKKFLTWRQSLINEFNYNPLKCLICGSDMKFHIAHSGMSHKQLTKQHKNIALRRLINF